MVHKKFMIYEFLNLDQIEMDQNGYLVLSDFSYYKLPKQSGAFPKNVAEYLAPEKLIK